MAAETFPGLAANFVYTVLCLVPAIRRGGRPRPAGGHHDVAGGHHDVAGGEIPLGLFADYTTDDEQLLEIVEQVITARLVVVLNLGEETNGRSSSSDEERLPVGSGSPDRGGASVRPGRVRPDTRSTRRRRRACPSRVLH